MASQNFTPNLELATKYETENLICKYNIIVK
jgi:hypothetical protein